MSIKTIDVIQKNFVDWHVERGFVHYKSFPLVSETQGILFNNATITPVKTKFTKNIDVHNFVLVQKCLRLGGSTGNIEAARLNSNYTSIFTMLGSGLFNISLTEVIDYLIDLLAALGLNPERLVYAMGAKTSFSQVFFESGVPKDHVILLSEESPISYEWIYGEGDLHGCGIVVYYISDTIGSISEASILESQHGFIELGRLVQMDGIDITLTNRT